MRPLEKPAVLLLLTFAFCGCTRTSEVKTDDKLDVQEEVKARSTEQTAETVQTGPGRTVVYKFAEPEGALDCAGLARCGASVLPPSGSGLSHPFAPTFRPHRVATDHPDEAPAQSSTDSLPEHGPLVEMDVIDTGPVLDTKTASTQTAVDTSLTGKQEKASDTKKKTSYWPPWWVWALGACGVALGIAIVRKTLLGKAVAAAEAAAKEVL